ncbi:MAG TPA: transporter substrate-binding domain-containing protein [Spirochaetia bacterium]|nr:transporter substrate-binding domain-containing protein [Spirochaetia bacterium]
MMRRLVTVLLLVLIALPVFATGVSEEPVAGDTALERTPSDPRLYQPGKLTVATGEPVFPPWMMDDDPAGGVGFENGLVYALAEELGFDREDVVWVRQTFDQGIAPGPKAYDFNIQQFSVTEARREFVDFSIVYYQPEKAVVALPGSIIADAESFADLRSARWGATIGTTDLDYIENRIGADDVAVFDDQVGTFQSLLAEQIDATVISLPTALFATAVQVPEATIAAILPPDPNDLGHGLVFEKGNPIVDWVNEGLEAIIARGVVADLTSEYLIGDDSILEISE